MSLLADRYGRALFEVATAHDAVDPVLADLAAIGEVLAEPRIAAVVLRGEGTGALRRRVVEQLGSGRHQLVRNLLGVLERRRRLAILGELPESFAALVRESRNIVVGVAEAPRAIGDDQLRQLEELAGRLSGKTVQLTFRANPDLIGGVRLALGNTLYDGSVATQLDNLERRLLAAPLH